MTVLTSRGVYTSTDAFLEDIHILCDNYVSGKLEYDEFIKIMDEMQIDPECWEQEKE